jgi:hypothetical protein
MKEKRSNIKSTVLFVSRVGVLVMWSAMHEDIVQDGSTRGDLTVKNPLNCVFVVHITCDA